MSVELAYTMPICVPATDKYMLAAPDATFRCAVPWGEEVFTPKRESAAFPVIKTYPPPVAS